MTKTALILAAAIAASSTAAFAQTAEPVASVRVSFADLNLSQKAGRATLEARVGRAVSSLCEAPPVWDLVAVSRYRACRKTAWSSVRPQLAAVYADARYASREETLVAARAE